MLGRIARGWWLKERTEEPGVRRPNQILTEREIVSTDHIYFAATGVTDGMLLDGVSFQGNSAATHSW